MPDSAKSDIRPKRILFVCMGNICRSPAAEAIFRHKARQAGLEEIFPCDSAGTIAYHGGDQPDRRMREAASRRGYTLEGRSRKVTRDDFQKFDRIVAMDHENLESLRHLAPDDNARTRLSLMGDYARQHRDREVPDPYYGGGRGFEHVLDLLEDACEGLLNDLRPDGD